MSDYTPTTEEVRNQYSGFSTSNSNHTGQVYINLAKFDRWLAEVKADAYDKAIRALFVGPAELLEIKAQAWEEGLEAKFKLLEGQESVSLDNPYRQGEKIILSNNDYDQLRKALDEK